MARTQRAEFRIPILKALSAHTLGCSKLEPLYDEVHEIMKQILTEDDYELTNHKGREPEPWWKNLMRLERDIMANIVRPSLLVPKTSWGLWIITKEGDKYLDENLDEWEKRHGIYGAGLLTGVVGYR